ncbi:MAG: F0F1 ATP synthase subunit A [Candidatus Pacebacteria bacterium]|jgi:F-type H+-transporting ATPase subunit a|nr:F0F1 ATP synthase subunit A [Candidatus Paceibacterota bacterium]
MPDVSLAPHIITTIYGWPITNAMLASLVLTVLLALVGLYARATFRLVPTGLQVVFESMTSFFMSQLQDAFGSEKRARRFFPVLTSLFIFILLANQFSVFPLITSLIRDGVVVFRTPTTDLSLTIGLAVVMIGGAHFIAFSRAPLGHIGNFIKIGPFFKVRSFAGLFDAGIGFFLGFLDIVGELAKIISMSFRLFGNVFAGEVMVLIIASISASTAYVLPIPFMVLSIFSGFVQAFVFMILATQFIAGTVGSEE